MRRHAIDLATRAILIAASSLPWATMALAQGRPTDWRSMVTADGGWTTQSPERIGRNAIYDQLRDRVLAFDDATADIWVFQPGALPRWSLLSTTGSPPTPRNDPSAVYDPIRDRLILFGGKNGVELNEAWALDLGEAPIWTLLDPSGSPPSGRAGSSAVYDPLRDRVIVFGGSTTTPYHSDIWSLNLSGTPAWQPVETTGTTPGGRTRHSAIYDSAGDRMILFGGENDFQSATNELWQLALSGTPSWQILTVPGPPGARQEHSAIHDPLGGRMIVFGGRTTSTSSNFKNDTWALALSAVPTWTSVVPSGTTPDPRRRHAAVYDAGNHQMLVLNGLLTGLPPFASDDVWSLDLTAMQSWRCATPGGLSPPVRMGASAVLSTSNRKVIYFGGAAPSASTYFNDVWAFDTQTRTWAALTPSGTAPCARTGHCAIYDPVRNRMVVFGGLTAGCGLQNDVWLLSLGGSPSWTPLGALTNGPTPRSGHAALYDPLGDRMIVFGGNASVNEVWSLALSGTPAWTLLMPSGTAPGGGSGYTAVFDAGRAAMLVFNPALIGIRSLSLTGMPAWSPLATSGIPPSTRNGASVVHDVTRNRILVFGGLATSYLNDIRSLGLSTATPTWELLNPSGKKPNARRGHAAIYDGVHQMIVHGGTPSSTGSWILEFLDPVDAPPQQELMADLGLKVSTSSNRFASVRFNLPRATVVSMKVYDVAGRHLGTLFDSTEFASGPHHLRFDLHRYPTGIHLLRMQAGSSSVACKCVIVK